MNRRSLEPRGQIVWQHVSFDDANDGLGDIACGSTSGASGRLGLRSRWTVVRDGGRGLATLRGYGSRRSQDDVRFPARMMRSTIRAARLSGFARAPGPEA